MEGRAAAPAAGTILNALATGTGGAFAIDEYITATVSLDPDSGVSGIVDGNANDAGNHDSAVDVTGTVEGHPTADTRLVERCVEAVCERFGGPAVGTVRTRSEVPMASGLKSSSAAANATVMATVDALDAEDELSREEAARIGVRAARDVGVTVTGAFDDASASMLGGITMTDNDADELLRRDERDWDVLVWTPPERAYSADADVDQCRRVTPMAELVTELALDGDYGRAMSVNGLAFCAALGFDTAPLMDALPAVEGVSLSGTGPSFTAVGDRDALQSVAERWEERPGQTLFTRTQTAGARIVA